MVGDAFVPDVKNIDAAIKPPRVCTNLTNVKEVLSYWRFGKYEFILPLVLEDGRTVVLMSMEWYTALFRKSTPDEPISATDIRYDFFEIAEQVITKKREALITRYGKDHSILMRSEAFDARKEYLKRHPEDAT